MDLLIPIYVGMGLFALSLIWGLICASRSAGTPLQSAIRKRAVILLATSLACLTYLAVLGGFVLIMPASV